MCTIYEMCIHSNHVFTVGIFSVLNIINGVANSSPNYAHSFYSIVKLICSRFLSSVVTVGNIVHLIAQHVTCIIIGLGLGY